MAELLTPGVIIQEIDFGPQPIEGVSTSTAGFVGETMWGPIAGPPLLVTSIADFERKFGGLVAGKHLPYAVRGFFENGGRRGYVARVAGAGALEGEIPIGNAARFVRLLAPPSGNQVLLSSVVGIGSTLNFMPRIGGSPIAATVESVNGATGVVTLSSAAPSVQPSTHFVLVGDPAPSTAPAIVVTIGSRYVGSYANRISVFLEPHFIDRTKIKQKLPSSSGTTRFSLERTDFLQVGNFLQLESTPGTVSAPAHTVIGVDAIDRAANTITTEVTVAQGDLYEGGRALLIGWRLTVYFDGQIVEVLEGLGTASFAADVETRSAWVVVKAGTSVALDPSSTAAFPHFPEARPVALMAGSDGSAADDTNYQGSSSEPRSGLAALEAQDGINIIAAPGQTSDVVIDTLIGQAERRQDRFAVFEAADGANVAEVLVERAQFNSRYAAMYHPWLVVRDPLSRTDIHVPPSGHVLGCYARTDNERGVFKAPANVVIRGIRGFTVDVPTGEQDVLNPEGVNVLRQLDGLGRVIWGARTITAEGLWKYVPVRRLFIFLEQSIVRGTRFAVFEPNDHRLWARLRDAVTNFLTTQWREGALFGEQPEHAFFVHVNETTTTQDDRDNGRVNIVVGIAPVKPAEFIVFRIGQAPTSVIIAEDT